MRSRSLLGSFNYAIEGIAYTLRTQRNMRIHVGIAAGVLLVSAALGVDRQGLIAICFSIAFVLVAELANTALEAAVDVATDRYDPLAKTAKDVAAGAVLIAAANAVAVGYLVLFEPLRRAARSGLDWVHTAPADLTVVALGLVTIAVLVVKALTLREQGGTFLRGGWPSGHTALATGVAAAIGFLTGSAGAFVLAMGVAVLMGESRVESEAHSLPQVVLGGLLGLLISTFIFQIFWR